MLKLEKRLKFTIKGANFLEFKREQLIKEIKEIWPQYQSYRKRFLELLRAAMITLNEIYKDMGVRNLNMIIKLAQIQYSPRVNIRFLKKIGNIIPTINYELTKENQLPSYSFEGTSPYLDDLISIILKDFFTIFIQLAEAEDALLKFSTNFRRLNRRINGLKNTIIPNLIGEIKTIKDVLEELDRENFVRLKKTKDLITNDVVL